MKKNEHQEMRMMYALHNRVTIGDTYSVNMFDVKKNQIREEFAKKYEYVLPILDAEELTKQFFLSDSLEDFHEKMDDVARKVLEGSRRGEEERWI